MKNDIKDAVMMCEKITGKNLSLPVLSSILFVSENKNLKLIATNLEMGVEIIVPAKIEKEGKVAVPAGILNGFLSNLYSDEHVVFESKDKNLIITTQNSSTTIKCQPADDFPSIPKYHEKNKGIEISLNDFLHGLKSVFYASSLLNMKPEISSVYVYSDGVSALVFVATDSFRLAEKRIECEMENFKAVMIPHKSAIEIMRIFEEKDGKIKIITDKNQIFLEFNGINFVSRLVEGVFPDYRQVIPEKFSTDAVVDKNIFANSLKTAGIFIGKLCEVKIAVNTPEKSLNLATSNGEAGEHSSVIPAKITGKSIKMAFNHRYLSDCLPHIPSNDIILRFSGEGKPLIIASTKDNSFQYLTMPMNTA